MKNKGFLYVFAAILLSLGLQMPVLAQYDDLYYDPERLFGLLLRR